MNAEELIQAIEEAIGKLAQTYRGEADESDLYEASLLAVAKTACESSGGTVLLTNDGQQPASGIRFRRSPGNLWLGGFTFARVSFGGASPKHLEVHLGVYVLGVSGVAHECDIALLDGIEAERSRRGAVHPRRHGLIAAMEAKHYVASPGIGVGRAFLGLSSEIGQRKCSLAFPAKGSASVTALLARKHCECFDLVSPGSAAANRLANHLDQRIRNWLA